MGCGVRARDETEGEFQCCRRVSLSGGFAVTSLPGQKIQSRSRGVHEDSVGLLCVVAAGWLCGGRPRKARSCRTRTGVVVTPAAGDSRSAYGSKSAPIASCVSRRWAMTTSSFPRASWSVDVECAAGRLQAGKRDGDDLVLATSQLVARVSLANGAVHFTDPNGKALLQENRSPRVLEPGRLTTLQSGHVTKRSTAWASTRTRR